MHYLRIGLGILFLAPVLLGIPSVAMAAGPKSLVELSSMLIKILNSGTGFLILAGIIIYFWGITGSLFNTKQGKVNGGELRKLIGWGLITIFVMVSIWGIVRLLRDTLFRNDNTTSSSRPPSATMITTQFTNQ